MLFELSAGGGGGYNWKDLTIQKEIQNAKLVFSFHWLFFKSKLKPRFSSFDNFDFWTIFRWRKIGTCVSRLQAREGGLRPVNWWSETLTVDRCELCEVVFGCFSTVGLVFGCESGEVLVLSFASLCYTKKNISHSNGQISSELFLHKLKIYVKTDIS